MILKGMNFLKVTENEFFVPENYLRLFIFFN